MTNNTIEPHLLALLSDAIYGPSSSSPSLELPPLHDPNILKASGRPLLLEPDASQGNGTQKTNTQLSSKHSSSILLADGENERAQKDDSKSKLGGHIRERALGETSPQSLRKILDDNTQSPVAHSAKKRQNGGTSMDGFLKLPQPPPKKQKTVKQVVPPIIIGLFQPPDPPSQAALFPPIASSSFHDSHGRNTLNTVPPRAKVSKNIPIPEQFDEIEKPKEDIDIPTERPKRNATRTRKKWTEEETKNLLLGVAKHGTGSWKDILDDPAFVFNVRSTTDLKDRFRTCCPTELGGKRGAKSSTTPLRADSGSKGRKPKSKSSLMSENILIPADELEPVASGLRGKKRIKEGKKRAHRKDMADLAQLGIDGPFRDSGRRQRRPYTDEEDRAILQGFSIHGASWRKIQLDDRLGLQSRSPTDIRDRYRYKFIGKPKSGAKSPSEGPVLTTQQNSMATLTQEFDTRLTEHFGKETATTSAQDPSPPPFAGREGLRIQQIISPDQETPRIPNLQHSNSLFGFKDNFTFSDQSNMDSSDHMPFSQSFDWNSGVPAPFSSNIGEMDISRLLLDESWTDMPSTSGKEKQSFTDINSILTTSAEPLHNGPSFLHMLNIDEMNEGPFG